MNDPHFNWLPLLIESLIIIIIKFFSSPPRYRYDALFSIVIMIIVKACSLRLRHGLGAKTEKIPFGAEGNGDCQHSWHSLRSPSSWNYPKYNKERRWWTCIGLVLPKPQAGEEGYLGAKLGHDLTKLSWQWLSLQPASPLRTQVGRGWWRWRGWLV